MDRDRFGCDNLKNGKKEIMSITDLEDKRIKLQCIHCGYRYLQDPVKLYQCPKCNQHPQR